MRSACSITTAILLAIATNALAEPNIIYVDSAANGSSDGSSWTSAFTDHQDALAHAASIHIPGDDTQIWIAAGTYTPGAVEDGPGATFHLIDEVSLFGGFTSGGQGEHSLDDREWNRNETVLTGFLDGATRADDRAWSTLTAVNLLNGATLDGLTVTGGSAWEWGVAEHGGGLLAVESTLIIANCTFIDNSAIEGGAIHGENSDITVKNTRFIANTAWDAGAIRITGGAWFISECEFIEQSIMEIGGAIWASSALLDVHDTLFLANHADFGLGFAGAAVLHDADATFTNCIFTENSAYGPSTLFASGSLTLNQCDFDANGEGGFTLWGDGEITVNDSSFTSNDAGAIAWDGEATIVESTFTGNTCTGPKCGAGGVELSGSAVHIHGSTFDDNFAPFGGNLWIESAEAIVMNSRITGGSTWEVEGGLRFSGGTLLAVNTLVANNVGGIGIHGTADAALINCTVISNPGDTFDNLVGVFVASGASASVVNSILWGNADEDEQSQITGPAELSYSIVQGLSLHTGNNNLGDDPLFVDADGRLSPNSPAIDAGDNDAFLAIEIDLVDLDDNPRIVDGTGDENSIIDLGAFEFQPTTPSVPGDLTGDGKVGVPDLLILLDAWGPCDDCAPGMCPADLTGNCNVGVPDLLVLLANWG